MNTAPPVASAMLAPALAYAARGWHVFPAYHVRHGLSGSSCSCGRADCGSPGKHPRTAHGFKDATTDEATIRAWWAHWPQANIGIATGAVSRMVALDLDLPKGADVSLGELYDDFGELPETVEANTAGGGRHVLFDHPNVPVKNSEGAGGWVGKKGIDFRGDGGYIIAAPSNHVSGQRYAWCDGQSPDEIKLAQMPIWLIEMSRGEPKPKPAPARPSTPPPARSPNAQKWLDDASASAVEGERNGTGYWLAQQLRDDGLSYADAEPVMLEYQRRADHGAKSYTVAECLASLRSAFKEPKRDPARSKAALAYPATCATTNVDVLPVVAPPPAKGAAAELNDLAEDILSGKVSNVPMPWPMLTQLAQMGVPGSISVVCGDPGVGKTFWSLECLQFWEAQKIPAAVFFVEKDRKFHTHRLLAQLEGNGSYIDYPWMKLNPDKVRSAMARHAARIDELGKSIASEAEGRLTLPSLTNWLRQMASAGKRMILIDPITAADAGRDRWMADDTFITEANKIVMAHGCSLILITHPKGGNRPGSPTAKDMGGGTAYNRFVDVNLWLQKPQKPKWVLTNNGKITMKQSLSLFTQMHKTRNGRGAGFELGFVFDSTLRFAEQGLVLKEANERDTSFSEGSTGHFGVPQAPQDPFLDDVP